MMSSATRTPLREGKFPLHSHPPQKKEERRKLTQHIAQFPFVVIVVSVRGGGGHMPGQQGKQRSKNQNGSSERTGTITPTLGSRSSRTPGWFLCSHTQISLAPRSSTPSLPSPQPLALPCPPFCQLRNKAHSTPFTTRRVIRFIVCKASVNRTCALLRNVARGSEAAVHERFGSSVRALLGVLHILPRGIAVCNLPNRLGSEQGHRYNAFRHLKQLVRGVLVLAVPWKEGKKKKKKK